MDADRQRRRHRRRCLMSCRPLPGRPRRGLRDVQQLAETAGCCNDRCRALRSSQSCQRKRDAVLHCATQLHCRRCHCSCEMVLQNPVLHFPVLHFLALQNGPPFSGPVFASPSEWSSLFRSAFSGPAFSEILVLQIPVLLFSGPRSRRHGLHQRV